MSDSNKIISGQADHKDSVSEYIYESSHELFDFMFSDRHTAINTIKKLYAKKRGYFSYKFATVMVSDEKVIGVQLGYDMQQLSRQELIGGISLFLASPVNNWWNLALSVAPIISDYVPAPNKGAYYINNIAISSTCRGGGLGTYFLKATLEGAQKNGYHSVELDVTAPNEGAQNFYKKHGFVAVSRSGDGDKYQQCGLPPLIRMVYTFAENNQLSVMENQHINPLVISEVTGLYPTKVDAVFTPGTVDQLQNFIQQTDTPISIGGGRFSMGGQIAAEGSVHIDMRGLNKIINFDLDKRVIRVQSGIRWRDIQQVIDGYGLAIKIQQTYSDFTVGGAISVNCHGRYIGLGPLIMSIRSLVIMLHDGSTVEVTAESEPDLFYSSVGGYGSVGIIVEAELDLVENTKVERIREKVNTSQYLNFFRKNVRDNSKAIFHNADLYPPEYKHANAVSWVSTDKPVTTKDRLNKARRLYLIEKYFMWAITETPFGKWRREYIIDPLIFYKSLVHWRNYEAGYHVSELEPVLRDKRTYVLQEYFIPVDKFLDFTEKMGEILNRHGVNVVNVSVRHAHEDPGSHLRWAREEVFAFVLYYKQRTRVNARERVAVWTRELIDAAIEYNGSYYLPYQPHATKEQFNAAYPDADKLFEIKRRVDPKYRFRNCLWDMYYDHDIEKNTKTSKQSDSEFISIYSNTKWRDRFYLFLQNIYHIYPEDRFHVLIIEACTHHDNDKEIYRYIQERLAGITSPMSDVTYALPALVKQKKVITQQTKELLGDRRFHGYLEIGSTGRYVKSLKKTIRLSGPVYLCNDNSPDYSLAEIMERGKLSTIGKFFNLNNYAPITESDIKSDSLDLVSCYIGLHHCAPDKLDMYIQSVKRCMRDQGIFILRDHNADTPIMTTFSSLVHTVFNAGLGVSYEDNQQEERYFNSVEHWIEVLKRNGFDLIDGQLLQDHDPSINTLMAFINNQ